ncbi:MAG: OmpA family protein [Desulfovibrio sp.]
MLQLPLPCRASLPSFALVLLVALLCAACAMPVVRAVRTLNSQAERIQAELFNNGAVDLDIRFASGKTTILKESIPLLNDAASALEDVDKEKYILQIIGHTDTTGPAKFNETLSFGRARAVLAYLRDNKGMPWWFMTPVGKGESEPKISPEKSTADRATNRRVEFRLVRKED